MYVGTVSRLVLDRGYGFITLKGHGEAFFHVNTLSDELPFDESLQERRVQVEWIDGPKGRRAFRVEPAID